MEDMKKKLLIAYVGEFIGGGFYLKLSELTRDNPEISTRLRATAGDEMRHGGYFNKCYQDVYGGKLFGRNALIKSGKMFAYASQLVPNKILFKMISQGEKAALVSLEKELKREPLNPYLEVAERILPDERKHAEPFFV